MTTYITEYFDNTELPYSYKDNKLIKFKGFKNNGIAEGPCIIGYINIFDNYFYKEVNYINDLKNGPYKIYNENGFIYEEGIYINDLKNGPYKIYYKNRKIDEEGIYINDMKNGTYKIYYPDGNLFEEGIYENNKKIEIIK